MDELLRIYENFKRNVNKNLSQKHLKEKYDFIQTFKKDSTNKTYDTNALEKINEALNYCEDFIHKRLNPIQSSSSSEDDFETPRGTQENLNNSQTQMIKSEDKIIQNIKMATLDIQTANKTIPEFKGNPRELDHFLKIVELIHKTISEANVKTDLIDFVYHVKLSNNVRTALSATQTPTTYETLKQTLQEKFPNRRSVADIHNTLANTCQRNQSVTTFKDKILNLINELNSIQIKALPTDATQAEKDLITKLNDQYALSIFKNGLNSEIKPTVLASRPKSFIDAINIALEAEPKTNAARVDYIKGPTNQNNTYRNSNRNRLNSRNSQNHNNYNNDNNYRNNRRQNYNNNNSRQQTYYNNQQNHQNQNQNGHRHNNNHEHTNHRRNGNIPTNNYTHNRQNSTQHLHHSNVRPVQVPENDQVPEMQNTN